MSTSAAPASIPTSVSPTSIASSSASPNSRTVAIAVGVSVSVGVVVAIGIIAFLLFRLKQKDKAYQAATEIGPGDQVNELPQNIPIRELKEDHAPLPPQELDSGVVRSELDTPTGAV